MQDTTKGVALSAGGENGEPHVTKSTDVRHVGDEKGAGVSTHWIPGTGRRLAIFGVFLLIGLTALWALGRLQREREQARLAAAARENASEAPRVNVVRPTRGAADSVLTLPGEARAFYETTIYARTSGYLKQWLVDIGDRVKAGQLLAVIETPELDEQLAEARAKVVALNADVDLAQTQVDFAKVTAARWESAAPEGAVSQQERDEKHAQLLNARAKLAAANAQLELGQADVRRLEFQTSFQKVLAPFDGTITQRHTDIGSLITAGSTANTTPLFSIAQYSRIRVFTRVPQSAVPEIKVGMAAVVDAREFPGQHFAGHVSRTSEAVEPSSRTLNVEVLVPNPDLQILPGMYVTVDFRNKRAKPPIVIPASALNITPSGPAVAEVRDGCIYFQKVQIARDLGNVIEIGAGLKGDEWVALNISNQIENGEHVEAVPVNEGVAENVPAGQTSPASAESPGEKQPEGSVADIQPAPHGHP